jgi:putative ubiquitin-RnfH superfamily antitoxin RatB of RatAB toxin-antitoxin module
MAPAESTVSEPVSASTTPLNVEVAVSVAPREVQRVRLQVPAGSTVRDALLACGLMSSVPGLSPEALRAGQWMVGVWGRKERLGHPLRDQDRIELVRPLVVDPKEARRLRYQDHLKKWPKGSQRIKPSAKGKKMAPSSGA